MMQIIHVRLYGVGDRIGTGGCMLSKHLWMNFLHYVVFYKKYLEMEYSQWLSYIVFLWTFKVELF
jgi:hypothetical protein